MLKRKLWAPKWWLKIFFERKEASRTWAKCPYGTCQSPRKRLKGYGNYLIKIAKGLTKRNALF